MQSDISEKTLTFYEACPFNFVSSVKDAAKYIRSCNLIERTYIDLDRILRGANVNSFLDAGCGIGWLSLTAGYYYNANVLGLDFNGEDTYIPLGPAANLILPSEDDIIVAIRRILKQDIG